MKSAKKRKPTKRPTQRAPRTKAPKPFAFPCQIFVKVDDSDPNAPFMLVEENSEALEDGERVSVYVLAKTATVSKRVTVELDAVELDK